jgi:outer membrane protein
MRQLSLAVALTMAFVCRVDGEEPQATSPARPTRIALVDMAHVFKNYKKFQALRSDLQAEIKNTDAEAAPMTQSIRTLQDELKQLNLGSAKYPEVQKKLASEKQRLEEFRNVTHADFLRSEAQIYRTVYLEVKDVLKKVASERGFDVVMRFDRELILDISNPPELVLEMNRQTIVYHDPRYDLTDAVLTVLNEEYASDDDPAVAIRPGRQL